MKVRLGYVAISMDLPKVTSSSHVTFSHYSKLKEDEKFQKLKRVTQSNLIDLEIILNYNIDRSIHFYRLTSKLIPLATHPEVDYAYGKEFKDYFKMLGDIIINNNLRVDTHPDQFNVINSDRASVVENTKNNLLHHVDLFDLLGYEHGKMVIHVGSSKNGKEKSLERFKKNFNSYPKEIRDKLIIENDDKVYTAKETLGLCKELNVPMVLDVHHHLCNSGEEKLKDLLEDIFLTWKDEYYPPKIHVSTGRESKLDRKHSDYINVDDFIEFVELAKQYDIDFDVMIEAKKKDHALIKLVEDLKEKTTYEWVDDSTFIVK